MGSVQATINKRRRPMLGSSYPLLNTFWTILYFFLLILWFMILFRVIWDIFRSHDLSGLGKAGWLLFILILPFLGVFVYVLARGGSMHERDVRMAQSQDQAFRSWIQQGGGGVSTADELTKLADLRSKGVITDAEFDQAKAKILA
jgi:magnesium-transporting ATPase (P-type)